MHYKLHCKFNEMEMQNLEHTKQEVAEITEN